jgi:hypothetical protein
MLHLQTSNQSPEAFQFGTRVSFVRVVVGVVVVDAVVMYYYKLKL